MSEFCGLAGSLLSMLHVAAGSAPVRNIVQSSGGIPVAAGRPAWLSAPSMLAPAGTLPSPAASSLPGPSHSAPAASVPAPAADGAAFPTAASVLGSLPSASTLPPGFASQYSSTCELPSFNDTTDNIPKSAYGLQP